MSDLSIHQRMIAVLGDLPAIGKDQKNVQQGFMFRGHDDVLNALNPLLSKHGVFVVPDVLERHTDHRVTGKGSTMYEVNLHVRFTFYGAGGDSVSGTSWGEGTDMGDKATNKAMTMAFKYMLFQAFAISSKEASDADAETPEQTTRAATPSAEKKPQPKSEGSFAAWEAEMASLGVTDPAGWAKAAAEASGAKQDGTLMAKLGETLAQLRTDDPELFPPVGADPEKVSGAFTQAFGVLVEGPA